MATTVSWKTSVSFGIVSELTVDNETVTLILEKAQDSGVTVYRGGMVAGQRLLVVALLAELVPELEAPSSLQNLTITKMAVALRPDTGSMMFEAAIENVWAITLEAGPTLSIDELSLSVRSIKPPNRSGEDSQNSANNSANNSAIQRSPQNLSQQRAISFVGRSRLFGGDFSVAVAHRFVSVTIPDARPGTPPAGSSNQQTASQLTFSAIAQNISITEVIKAFGFSQAQVNRYGLSSLVVSLEFELERTNSKRSAASGAIEKFAQSRYSFRGSVDWDTGIQIGVGDETLQVEAVVQIASESSSGPDGKTSALSGKIEGIVSASIPFFDTLQLSVIYTFTRADQARTDLAARNTSQALTKRASELIFQLRISSLLLSAVYTSLPDPKAPTDTTRNHQLLRFNVSLVTGKNPTIGDLIAYIVSLYDPSLVDFELDPPWDEFAKQEIRLDKFGLEVDLTEKRVTISYQETLNVLIAKVSNVGLSYQFGTPSAQNSQRKAASRQGRTASSKKVAIALNLSIPGQPQQRVQWDPVNENPPDVPGAKAPIVDLHFLALGQRVAFAPEIVQQARTIKQFTDVMRESLVPLPPIKRQQNPLTAMLDTLPSAVSSDPTAPINFSGPPIRFSAESGWLIGAQFVILGAFDLSIVFNDPFIYGLRIGLSGPIVKIFDGLEFEILYRRISDTVGVYRTELTLPDAMRQLQFGAVAITLPTVAIEIYTNGDFGLDVGFPWGGDFSRSVAVEALIFIGVGGFYFNKLSAETARSVPVVSDGAFNPVLEFGLGLKLGLGRTFTKGPLNAEISVTLHGLLQGVIAWFNPTDTRRGKELYYRVQGGVAIVGRIYGEVDFKVIQVNVEVIAKVGVLFVVEVYKAIQIALIAKVSVRASIKVLFVRVRFKFSLTVRESFTLGSDSAPPWTLAAGSAGAMAATLPIFSARPARAQPLESAIEQPLRRGLAQPLNQQAIAPLLTQRTLRWTNGATALKLSIPQKIRPQTLKNDKLRLDIYFQIAITKTDAGIKGIGLLFIENAIPPDEETAVDSDTDFDELVKALLKWAVFAGLSDSERDHLPRALSGAIRIDSQPVSLAFLKTIYKLFVDRLRTDPADSFWQPLIGFLSENFIFDITDRPLEKDSISGTVFPMFPQLDMTLGQGKDDPSPTVVDFDAQRFSPAQIQTIQTYFKNRRHNHDQSTQHSLAQMGEVGTAEGELAIAQLLFIDYFTLIIRSAIQLGIDHLKQRQEQGLGDSLQVIDLLDSLSAQDADQNADQAAESSAFESLAGMTSRFLLHGLRLPTFSGSNTAITGQAPVYQITGQQFDIAVQQPDESASSSATTTSPNHIRLSKTPGALSWIRLIDDPIETAASEVITPEFNYDFDPALTASIIQMAAASADSLPTGLPALLPFYKPTHQRYALRQKVTWKATDAAENNLLWLFPLGLTDYLTARASVNAMPALSLLIQSGQDPGQPLLEDLPELSDCQWATRLTIEIRQVVHSTTGDRLPFIYAIEPIEASSIQPLRQLAAEVSAQIETVQLLYAGSDLSGLSQDASAEIVLLKTRLTDSVSSSEAIAALESDNAQTFQPFLALLAESAISSSGSHYLSYRYTDSARETQHKGLPENLFSGEETAKITLLVTYASSARLKGYHNALQILSSSSQIGEVRSATDIVAQSSEQTEVLQLPAGNIGFTLTRLEPEDDPKSAIDELETLYQLLNYSVTDGLPGFISDNDTLPVGPVETEDEKAWLYEKVLPVYALTTAEPNAAALPEVLQNTLNPYYGIGDLFKLDFQWQDVYGNRFGDRPPHSFSQQIGYVDPIVGLNQWPSVAATYRIQSSANAAQQIDLLLSLAFDQAKYLPSPTTRISEALDRIKTDRATYQQIYYQVHDLNTSFTLKTSIAPDWQGAFPRSVLESFVDSVYRYLVTLEQLKTFEYRVWQAHETLQTVADRYGLTVEELAEANAAVRGLWEPSQILIPVKMKAKPEESFRTLADRLTDENAPAGDPPLTPDQKIRNKAREIVRTHAKTTGLLETDISPEEATPNLRSVLGSSDLQYELQPEETFESIAIAQLAIQEDKLVNAELHSIAQSLNLATLTEQGALFIHSTNAYVTFQTTLETISYNTLRLENKELAESFEQLLSERIILIAAQNNLDAESPNDLIPADTTLTLRGEDTISIKVVEEISWQAIATAFSTAQPLEAIVLSNANRPDWLAEGAAISLPSGEYILQAHDTLLHIALSQFVLSDTRTRPALNTNIAAEVGALSYPIETAAASRRSLAALTQQLQLQTHRHRTVLETVRAVGNMSLLLTEETLNSALIAVADAVSPIRGLFGTRDVILADLLFDYTVKAGDSLESIANFVETQAAETTVADLALQNADKRLTAECLIAIPDRFHLDLALSADRLDRLALSEPSAETSLAGIAQRTNRSVAALAIANQTLVGRLNQAIAIEIAPVLQSLLSLKEPDFSTLSHFVIDKTEALLEADTLYALTRRLTEGPINRFRIQVEAAATATAQAIGTLNAIYEQMGFEKANFAALSALLTPALGQIRAALLDSNSQFQPFLATATVHSDIESLDVLAAIDAVEAAQNGAGAILADQLKRALSELNRLYEVSKLKLAVDVLAARAQSPVSVSEVGSAIATLSDLIVPHQRWIVPPQMAETTLPIDIGPQNNLAYPSELIFPVSVQIDMRRPEALMHRQDGKKAVIPEAESILGSFSPKTIAIAPPEKSAPGPSDSEENQALLASLSPFATAFEAALPHLKLSVGHRTSTRSSGSNQELYAVHMGETGVSYRIKSDHPLFFSVAPLATSLMSATVTHYAYSPEDGLDRTSGEQIRVEAVDLNALARTYLQAVEDILKPEIAMLAASDTEEINGVSPKAAISRILSAKARLANVISQTVTHVLEPDHLNLGTLKGSADYEQHRQTAAATLKQALLANLAEAYDIETIVQYAVEVEIAGDRHWPAGNHTADHNSADHNSDLPAPQLSGQPTILSAYYNTDQKTPHAGSSSAQKNQLLQTLDFSLSPAKLALPQETLASSEAFDSSSASSTLTFLFNTQTPQRYEDIVVDLTYQVNELEYSAEYNPEHSPEHSPGHSTSTEQATSWLTFVLPIRTSFTNPSPTPSASTPPSNSLSSQLAQANHIGEAQIPLPLRNYPIPPSLIAHQALPDPDGFAGSILGADSIRDWNYVFLYEHPDVAQDTIECRIDYNSGSQTQPALSINSVSVSESAGVANFVVTLFPPASEVVTVDYATQDGSATASQNGDNPPGNSPDNPPDYTAVSGRLTFAPGDTTRTITVPILSDAIIEDNEAFTVVLSNPQHAIIAAGVGTGTIIDAPLLDSLIRFDRLSPRLISELEKVDPQAGIIADNRASVVNALNAFAILADEVANAWAHWQPALQAASARANIHYNIDEELIEGMLSNGAIAPDAGKLLTITPTPNLADSEQQILQAELPGYAPAQNEPVTKDGVVTSLDALTVPYRSLSYRFSKLANATGVETFGESDIPDRKITVIDLDVLKIQNAWSAIRVARNKHLIDGRTTNPAFIFQTPEVRFKDRITPLIINDKRWNIAALSNTQQSLAGHLQTLFETLLPATSDRPYDLRIACQYAFAIATGTSQTDTSPSQADLLTALPVLLTPRFTVQQTERAPNMLAVTAQLRRNLVIEIEDWQTQKRPNQNRGRYVFSISLFSHNLSKAQPAGNPNLPLLKVDHLWLALSDIQ